MPFEPSAIPAAIDGLVDLCSGMTLDGVPVFVRDGPIGTHEMPNNQLLLIVAGYLAGESGGGATVARGEQRTVTLPGTERDERFEIYCTAISRSGETSIRAERVRAFKILSEVEKKIRPHQPGSDHTLGGAVLWAEIGEGLSYEPASTNNGAIVRVGFEIKCRARLDG